MLQFVLQLISTYHFRVKSLKVQILGVSSCMFIYFITHFLWKLLFTFKGPTMLHAGFRLVLGDLHFYLQSHSSNKAYLLVIILLLLFFLGGGGGGVV